MHLEWYLPGPPLDVWLESTLADARVRVVFGRDAGRGFTGRRVRRLISRWCTPAVDGARADITLVVTSFATTELGPAVALERTTSGAVIELAHRSRWTPGALLRPGARARQARAAGRERARLWLRAGLLELVQWSPVDPHGVLVTRGRLSASRP